MAHVTTSVAHVVHKSTICMAHVTTSVAHVVHKSTTIVAHVVHKGSATATVIHRIPPPG